MRDKVIITNAGREEGTPHYVSTSAITDFFIGLDGIGLEEILPAYLLDFRDSTGRQESYKFDTLNKVKYKLVLWLDFTYETSKATIFKSDMDEEEVDFVNRFGKYDIETDSFNKMPLNLNAKEFVFTDSDGVVKKVLIAREGDLIFPELFPEGK